jgi:hypothetical protein
MEKQLIKAPQPRNCGRHYLRKECSIEKNSNCF